MIHNSKEDSNRYPDLNVFAKLLQRQKYAKGLLLTARVIIGEI
ncbi:MAG: hypothetical protein P0Y55_00190 [Candidatus Cohnella colombiensis]|uniref:Uncharacterized protein n=1 Tax=Candidatus Cohnella colombiensis TaxID=3121368 RepID=A0AA95EYW9_9BACL|nr:MAG: hypothetical protein P0Y55_00190 [Cohnella sp.]